MKTPPIGSKVFGTHSMSDLLLTGWIPRLVRAFSSC
jgi:hypothetical protein